MSEYVGLKKGKVHDKREMSEYYCGGCGYPVTDHDSYCRECGGGLHEGMGKSQWHALFGTPERAARTLVDSCNDDFNDGCGGCPLLHVDCKYGDYDALLEWLKGTNESRN